MPPRRVFDPAIPALVRSGREHLVPPELWRSIHPSCKSRWRRHAREVIGLPEPAYVPRSADLEARTRTLAYARLLRAMVRILEPSPIVRRALRAAMPAVVDAVQAERKVLGLRAALQVFGLSPSTYHAWVRQVNARCARSPLQRCRSRHPLQLGADEVQRMRQLLTAPERAHWPICSIALAAARDGVLYASLNTWYRYARLLGLTRRVHRKPRYGPGIRAKKPDDVWHADVLVAHTGDGQRHYIYLVQDNYSRRILAARVATELSGALRAATLREAWAAAPRSHLRDTWLVTDGGPENINRAVEGFVSESAGCVQLRIALKDIAASNSMIEAANKVLRYRYLDREAADGAALEASVVRFVQESNSVRPLQALGGRTPDEAYFGLAGPLALQVAYAEARQRRRVANRAMGCTGCAGAINPLLGSA